MPIKRAPVPERGFYRMANRIVDDRRLSWAARGMIAHLLSKPDDWTVSIKALWNETRESTERSGRDAVYRIVKELMSAGYITSQRKIDGSLEYTVHELPSSTSPNQPSKSSTKARHGAKLPMRAVAHPESQDPETPDEVAAQGFQAETAALSSGKPPMRAVAHPESQDPETPDPESPDVYQLLDKALTTEKAPSKSCALRSAHAHDGFDEFYGAYPKKKDRARAEKAFRKLSPNAEQLNVMLVAIENQRRSDEWRRDGGKFVPHPATWLNGRRWEDEPDLQAYTEDEHAVMVAYNQAMPDSWPRAVDSPYSTKRAAAIREFRTFSSKPGALQRYFEYCADNLAPRDGYGFDWLIGSATYLRVREGAVKHRESA